MNKLKTLLFLALFVLLPDVTYAGCTKDEINYFKRIEEEYKVEYEFDVTTKTYDLYLHSPENKMYAFDVNGYGTHVANVITSGDDITLHLSNVEPGTINIKINGVTETCDSLLKSYDLELAPYNPYSEDQLCEGIEDFYLCQPTYGKEIDYDTFVSRVETYKKNHPVSSNEPNSNNNQFAASKIVEFLKANLFEIIAGIVFIIVITITIILTAKSIKKRRRLE